MRLRLRLHKLDDEGGSRRHRQYPGPRPGNAVPGNRRRVRLAGALSGQTDGLRGGPLIDLPLEGLQAARKRADKDGLAERCRIVQADGAALPFPGGRFDAIYHSDVLCCLVEKQAVLEECRRVAGNQAKMVFSVISIPPGLSDADYGTAAGGGPTFIESPMDYAEMLACTGWTVTARGDVTAEYSETFAKMFGFEKANVDEIERVHDAEGAADLMARRQRTLEALERNLLRREIFAAVPAG